MCTYVVLVCLLVAAAWEGRAELREPDEVDCPEHVVPELFFSSHQTLLGTPERALKTVPERFVEVKPSGVAGAGLGAFALTFLPRYTWLGEYEGEVVPLDGADEVTYAWNVYRGGELVYYVDAFSMTLSNWLRYINCPRHVSEKNVEVATCYGRVYYYTSRDVLPGTELLIYYGDDYANELGIDTWEYHQEDICPHFTSPSNLKPGVSNRTRT